MKQSLKILAMAIFAAPFYSFIGCSAPSGFSYQNVSITMSALCNDCGVGVIYNPAYPAPAAAGNPAPAGSVLDVATGGNSAQSGEEILTANVTNAPSNVTWTLYPNPNLSTPNPPPTCTTSSGSCTITESGSDVGTLAVASGNTVYYASPSSVPIYTGAALQQAQALGIPQGMVLLVASVPDDPANPASVATASQLIQIYNKSPTAYLVPATPTTPSGLTSPVATIPRKGTFQFYGGVVSVTPCGTGAQSCTVGSTTYPLYTVDQNVVWAVGPQPASISTAVVGGNSTYGTISNTGLYTAPATVPPQQPVVYVWAEINSNVNKSALIAVQ